ncbi:MAG: hypothetical protein MJ237_06055 [bacterium]|nr:hypothetical protein [bacterium]
METEKYYQMEMEVREYHNNSERIRKGSHMGAALEDFINGASTDTMQDVVDYVLTFAHRTLQQKIFTLACLIIKGFAEMENCRVDGRNRVANEKAKKIYAFMQENYISVHNPLI